MSSLPKSVELPGLATLALWLKCGKTGPSSPTLFCGSQQYPVLPAQQQSQFGKLKMLPTTFTVHTGLTVMSGGIAA